MTDDPKQPWTITAGDDRVAVKWCTYPGECKNVIDEGPRFNDHMRENMYPVEAQYFPLTNKTRVGWSYQMPADVEALKAQMMARMGG